MTSFVLLLLRLVTGGLLIGHGGQKLFGWFGGAGVEGTAGWLASLRLMPPRQWAVLAGVSEFGGGLLTVLGLLNPMGPILATGAMLTAWTKVHLGKPLWASQGGAELPLTNLAVLAAIAVRGPGKLSLDYLLRIRTPTWLRLAALAGVVGGVLVAVRPELLEGRIPLGETDMEIEGDPSFDEDDQEAIRAAADDVEEALDEGFDDETAVDIAAMRRPED
jgi:putative oxidoreductase